MAAATCTAAGFAEAGVCFTGQVFNPKEQLAILAYISWKLGDAADQETTTFDQQISNTVCIADSLSEDKLMAALIGVVNRGIVGGQGMLFNTNVDQLTGATAMEAIACMKQLSEHQLKAIAVYNLCRFMGEIA